MKTISTFLKHYFLILMACFYFVGHAQSPTITASALPHVGYTYNTQNDTTTTDRLTFTVSPGSSSAQTWNYNSNFVTTYTQSSSFVAPSSGMGNSNFPSANLASGAGTAWAYYTSNSAGLSVPGEYIGGSITVVITFTPSVVLVPTPFTYGNVINNPYAVSYTYTAGGTNYKNSGHAIRTITADAFGTLTVPSGTYSNCLRNKVYETSIDTTYIQVGGNWTFAGRTTDTTTIYQWFQNNSNTFEIMNINFDKKGKVRSAAYLQSFSNEINAITGPHETATIYPNPANTNARVTVNSKNAISVNVYDINGNVVLSRPINETTIIDAGSLSEGVYTISISGREGTTNKKLVIVK